MSLVPQNKAEINQAMRDSFSEVALDMDEGTPSYKYMGDPKGLKEDPQLKVLIMERYIILMDSQYFRSRVFDELYLLMPLIKKELEKI